MNRRSFLAHTGAVATACAIATSKVLATHQASSSSWRTFEVKTSIEVLNTSGVTRIWMPALLSSEYQKILASDVHCEGGKFSTLEHPAERLLILVADFPAGVKPVLTVTNRAATRDRVVDLSGHSTVSRSNAGYTAPADLLAVLQPTKVIPTDGIVKQRAIEITRGARTDLEKARAIYKWIVANTYRNPKVRGCGNGDIRFMLESGDLGGKCADINALFVGLARAAGIPARDIYGIRVGKSLLGYKSLGLSSDNATKAQHCRAEVYLSDFGWVPVDPADVRKVMLEEAPGNRSPDDEMVTRAQARLFGSWEMNWLAYNFAQDVTLPGSSGPPVRFLMYPVAETSEGRLDSLDPDRFQYRITTRELTSDL